MSSILGFGSSEANTDGYALSPTARRLTDESYRRAMLSTPETEVAGLTSNLQPAQSPEIAAKSVIDRSAGTLGMMNNDSLSSAIADRAKKSYESDLNRLTNEASFKGPSMVSNKLQLASNNLLRKQRYEYELHAKKMQKEQSEEAARNATVGSVLGIVAMVALA